MPRPLTILFSFQKLKEAPIQRKRKTVMMLEVISLVLPYMVHISVGFSQQTALSLSFFVGCFHLIALLIHMHFQFQSKVFLVRLRLG
jgi:hypothetical protein